MQDELRSQVMTLLSEVLSATSPELAERLGAPEPDVAAELQKLVNQGYVISSNDTVAGRLLFAPSSRGIIESRRAKRSAF